MNISHRKLTGALEFALLNERLRHELHLRDQHKGAGAREVIIKFIRHDEKRNVLMISVDFIYARRDNSVPPDDDISLLLSYHKRERVIILKVA